jgi:hypothetical protein
LSFFSGASAKGISTGGCFETASENATFTVGFLKETATGGSLNSPSMKIIFSLAVCLIKPRVEIYFFTGGFLY